MLVYVHVYVRAGREGSWFVRHKGGGAHLEAVWHAAADPRQIAAVQRDGGGEEQRVVRAAHNPHISRLSSDLSLPAVTKGDKVPVRVPADARALPDSVQLPPPVLAHGLPSVDVDEAPRREGQVAAQEGGQVPLAHEAQAHGLGLGEHGQVGQVLRGQLPDLGLVRGVVLDVAIVRE